jgi:TonB family protein
MSMEFTSPLPQPAQPLAWPAGAALLAVVTLLAGCALPAPTPTAPREVSMAKATCQPTNYPDEARRLGAAGQTEVEMEVNPEGKVTRVAIIKSSGATAGHRALDALAISTISKCVFPPAPGFLSGTGRMVYIWRLDS